MASAIAHFIVGAALALPAIESRTIRGVLPRWAIPISCGALAVAPDLDTIAMRAFGIPYGSFFGHRGFFHSPFFLILLAGSLPAMAAGRRSSRATVWLGLLWAGGAGVHPFLASLTAGVESGCDGSGAALVACDGMAGFAVGGMRRDSSIARCAHRWRVRCDAAVSVFRRSPVLSVAAYTRFAARRSEI